MTLAPEPFNPFPTVVFGEVTGRADLDIVMRNWSDGMRKPGEIVLS